MRKNLHIYLLSAVIALHSSLRLISQNSSALPLKSSIGIRAGETSGFCGKYVMNYGNAFETIIGFYPYTFGFTQLYEKHLPTGADNLTWYMGAGTHLSFGRLKYRVYYDPEKSAKFHNVSEIAAGADFILGTEYHFKKMPLAISTELKPFTEINQNRMFYFSIDPAISLKYTLNKLL